MRTKEIRRNKVIAAILSVIIAGSAAASVSAANLTNDSNDGGAEVTAKVSGADEPGNVSYIIKIPEKLDFGTLTIPDNDNTDHFKDIDFNIEATDVKGLQDTGWFIRVKVKDQSYAMDEQELFYINQASASYPNYSAGNNKFTYSFYTNNGSLNSITDNRKDENGFNIAFFNAAGQKAACRLRLNQNQLYGTELKKIAGDYSGRVIFHSSIVNGNSLKPQS